MEYNVYHLLKVSPSAPPVEIMTKCQEYCERWTREAVQHRLEKHMSNAEAVVSSQHIWQEGERYIKSLAAMLLDPPARNCYDAWLDAIRSPTPEKNSLMRARIQWFNSSMHSSPITFSKAMLEALSDTPPKKKKAKTCVRTASLQPNCRACSKPFSFDNPYTVFHCHCTTRVGHTDCMAEFSTRFSGRCPVCRNKMLKRHEISKYLFWNVRDKYRFL